MPNPQNRVHARGIVDKARTRNGTPVRLPPLGRAKTKVVQAHLVTEVAYDVRADGPHCPYAGSARLRLRT